MVFGRRQKNPEKITCKQIVAWSCATCGYCSKGCSMKVDFNGSNEAASSRGLDQLWM